MIGFVVRILSMLRAVTPEQIMIHQVPVAAVWDIWIREMLPPTVLRQARMSDIELPPMPRPLQHIRTTEADRHTRGGTRTRNLLLRREAPYPLGHTSSCCTTRPTRISAQPSYRRRMSLKLTSWCTRSRAKCWKLPMEPAEPLCPPGLWARLGSRGPTSRRLQRNVQNGEVFRELSARSRNGRAVWD